jgi:neutral ceramidase
MIWILLLLSMIPAAAGELRLGRAAVKITPAVGTPMGGSYALRPSKGVLDDLYAKALVLEKDGARAALVACDLISVSAPVVSEARKLIERDTGLRAEQVMISATHTHSGPYMLSGSGRDSAFGAQMEIEKQYIASLPGKIAESVRLAAANLAPARVSAAVMKEDAVSFNRRFVMRDGTVGWNPGRLNPNVVRPAGPIDPDVAVVYFDSPNSQPLATYVNHPLHVAVIAGLEFSADYPHTIAKLLADVKGPDMLTVFTIGTAGNVNHINVSSAAKLSGPAESARIGTILAGDVLKAYAHLTPIDPGPLQFRREIVKLPLAAIKPGDLEQAREVASRVGQPKPPKTVEQAQAFKVLDVAARQGRPLEAEVQVITLGDQLAWVGLPGEIFVELGLMLKQASPFRYTIIAELANGSVGYVPNRKAYPEGNYEPVSARCAPGAGELLVDTATRLLVELQHLKPVGKE